MNQAAAYGLACLLSVSSIGCSSLSSLRQTSDYARLEAKTEHVYSLLEKNGKLSHAQAGDCSGISLSSRAAVGVVDLDGTIAVCFDYVQFFYQNDGNVFGLVYQFPYDPSRPFSDEKEQLMISDPENKRRFFNVAMSALDTMIASLQHKNVARPLARFEDAKSHAFSVYTPYYQKNTLHIPEDRIKE